MREQLVSEANYLISLLSDTRSTKKTKQSALRRVRTIERELGTTLYGGYNSRSASELARMQQEHEQTGEEFFV